MIQVVIIEKLLLVGEVLATLLRDEPDIRVVGLVASTNKAFDYLKAGRCDVVLLGNSFSQFKTLKMTLQIAENFPQAKIVIFSTAEADTYAASYHEAGAYRCIYGEHSPEELLEVIRSAAASTLHTSALAPHVLPT